MSLAAPTIVSLHGHTPETYVAHAVHRGERSYTETNCYTDILVELLHAAGHEPLAALAHLVRMDFEGDQWTFFKPPSGDLEALFGIDIHEMQPFGALPDQIARQLAAGRTMLCELDSWWLPDTAATDYRRAHVKTTVAVEAIDLAGERLRYFHNAGLHELSGEDYRGIFRLDGSGPDVLPPYLEVVRFDAGPALAPAELRTEARAQLAYHLARRPASNPFARFATQLDADLPRLLEGEAADFHAYAFATVRMAGSAFELLDSHAEWLTGDRIPALGRIVDGAKVLSFRLARRRAFDPEPLLAPMAAAWAEAMDTLELAAAT